MESESLRIIYLFEELAALKIPLAKMARDYLNYLESTRNASFNTIISYGRKLLSFIRFCKCQRINKIEQIEPKIIFEYFSKLKKQGNSSSTIYVVFESIKMLVKYAALEGIQSKNFMRVFSIQAPKREMRLPKVLTIDQVKRLLDISPLKYCYGVRDKAILELLYGTGIRANELVNLRVSDIGEDFILVFGKGSKERLIPITNPAIQAVKRYMLTERQCQAKTDKSDECLFLSRSGRPLRRHDVWRLVTKYARLSGLKNVSPHTLRHCYATHLFMNGADLRLIQEALGHSSISTTQIYTHVNIEQLKTAIEKYHPRT